MCYTSLHAQISTNPPQAESCIKNTVSYSKITWLIVHILKLAFTGILFTCSCTIIILLVCKFVACIFIFSTYSAPLHEALRASDPALKMTRQVMWQRMWHKLNYWLMDIFLVMQLSSYGQRNGMQKSIWLSFSVFRLQCYIVSTYFNIRKNYRRFSKLGLVLQLLICLAQSD